MPHDTAKYAFNQVTIDPAYFGRAATNAVNEQLVVLPVSRRDDGQFLESAQRAMRHFGLLTLFIGFHTFSASFEEANGTRL